MTYPKFRFRGFALAASVAAPALMLASGPVHAQVADVCGPTEIVQEGDTFSGIAERCGVPLSAIEEANPGIDPMALEIGSTVQIPTDAAGMMEPATPTAPVGVTTVQTGIPTEPVDGAPGDRLQVRGFLESDIHVECRLLRAEGDVFYSLINGGILDRFNIGEEVDVVGVVPDAAADPCPDETTLQVESIEHRDMLDDANDPEMIDGGNGNDDDNDNDNDNDGENEIENDLENDVENDLENGAVTNGG